MAANDIATLDVILARHNNSREALIQILLDVQKEFRWLSKPVLEHICSKLGIPMSYIYNIASFYKHFSLLPRGQHMVSVCLGTACHVRGATRVLDRVEKAIGVSPGETTADEKFTLETVNCLGCCALGPVMVVDGEYIGDPDVKKIEESISSRK